MTQVLTVVGVAGQKQAGKDTLADYLAARLHTAPYSFPWGRASFAAAVKRIYCETFQKDLAFIEKWKEVPECPPGMDMPVRAALQFIGDGFRQIQGSIWIDLAFRSEADYQYKVFSDLRYLNEARTVKSHGGFTLLLYRAGRMNYDTNKSESEIRPYLEWCESTGRTGFIREWPEYVAAIQEPGDSMEFMENLRHFDYFVRNDGTIDGLQRQIDDTILPMLGERYNLK